MTLAVARSTDSTLLPTKIVEASVFRSGLVMLVREGEVPAGDNDFHLQQIPQALENTFWYDSPDGAEISDLKTSLQMTPIEVSYNAVSVSQFLEANVGKRIEFTFQARTLEKLAGTELEYAPDQNRMTIRLDNNTARMVPLNEVVSISMKGLSQQTVRHGTKASLRVDLRCRAEKPAHIRFYSLEVGATWATAYRLDIQGSEAKLTARAELGLGGLGFQDVTTNLVTGFPDLSRNTKQDLAVSSASLSSWLYSNGTPDPNVAGPVSPDPYDRLERLVVLGQQSGYTYDPISGLFFRRGSQSFYQGGQAFDANPKSSLAGTLGGPGLVPDGIDFISFNPTDNSVITSSGEVKQRLGFLQNAINAQRLEDLYSYPMGSVTLGAGERLTRILSTTKSKTDTHFLWHVSLVPRASTNAIRRVLTVMNRSNGPWPAGTTLVTRNNVPLSEVAMPFTAVGKAADLDLGSADDLVKSESVKELSREPIIRSDGTRGQLVTNQVGLTVDNTRSEFLPIEVVVDLLGQVKIAAGAEVTKTADVQSSQNPASRADWHLNIGPGESRQMQIIYCEVI